MARLNNLKEGAMRPEYDFSRGARGRHAARYAAGVEVAVDPGTSDARAAVNRTHADPQAIELAGKHLVIAQLMAANIEVAEPVRDKGIDLIAYRESGEKFQACPIQLKVSSKRRLTLHSKYEKFHNLLMAFVWNVYDSERAQVYAMPYARLRELFEGKGYTKSVSYQKGGLWTIPNAREDFLEEEFKMDSPEKWGKQIDEAIASGR